MEQSKTKDPEGVARVRKFDIERRSQSITNSSSRDLN